MVLFEYSSYKPKHSEKKEMDLYLTFLCKLVAHNLEFSTSSSRSLPKALVIITLKRASKKEKEEHEHLVME